MKRIISFILLLFFLQPVIADDIYLGLEEDHYHESPTRRAEIVFFLSLPFTLLAQGLIISSLHLLDKPHEPLTITTPVAFFWVGSSLMISGGIAYMDYRNNKRDMPKNEKNETAYLSFTYPID